MNEASAAEDLGLIDMWVSAASAAEGFTFQRSSDDGADGVNRWLLDDVMIDGTRLSGRCQLVYDQAVPHVFAVQLVSPLFEPDVLGDEVALSAVFADHGLQLNCYQVTSGGEALMTLYGPCIFLGVNSLPVELWRPVAKRLNLALRDGLTQQTYRRVVNV